MYNAEYFVYTVFIFVFHIIIYCTEEIKNEWMNEYIVGYVYIVYL